jgi:uncharacterized protein (DUF433 family)
MLRWPGQNSPDRRHPPDFDFVHHELFQPMSAPTAPLISCTPGVRSGKPCLVGTRITVSDVLEYLASGMGQQDILADFPDIQAAHIQAVLRYAAEREKRLSELTIA